MARFNGNGVLPDCVLRKMRPEDRKALGKAGVTLAEAAAKQEAKREREIHEQIENWLRQREITYRHDRMDKPTTGTIGWPDFTFAVKGRAVALEVKMPGAQPSDDQIKCMSGLVRDGWFVRVVYSLADVLNAVREVDATG